VTVCSNINITPKQVLQSRTDGYSGTFLTLLKAIFSAKKWRHVSVRGIRGNAMSVSAVTY